MSLISFSYHDPVDFIPEVQEQLGIHKSANNENIKEQKSLRLFQ